MASMKKQKEMVFHQEGVATPTGEPPPQYLTVPKSGKPKKSGLESSILEINEMDDSMSKASMPQLKGATQTRPGLTSVKHPASSNLQTENLSPDNICKGVRVTLDNNNMWNEFFRCKTEMILTKQGSRMFPYCRFRISGLQPGRRYSLLMDIQPLDNSRYKWTGKSWQVVGKAEHPVKSRPFPHPESPSTGQHWMQTPVSFYKLKVTNNCTNQDGHIILHPMHRYIPRLHVIQTDKAAKDIRLNGPGVITFVFPQTEFMAVTSYQNSQFAQLKVDYNPFMKGLKDEGNSWSLKLKPGKDLHKAGGQNDNEQHPLRKSLKSLLANHKPKATKTADSTVCKDLQEKTAKTESTSTVPENCNPCPTQKLFSEIIREAHISLQRCSLEHQGDGSSPSLRNEPRSTQNNSSKNKGQDDSERDHISEEAYPGTPPQLKSDPNPAIKKDEEKPLKSPNCRLDLEHDSDVGDGVALEVPQKSVDSDCHNSGPSEENARKNKRPAPLPLPALALFLKQHLAKSKKASSKSDSQTPPFPSEPQSSAAVSESPHSSCVTIDTQQEVDTVRECDSDSAACVNTKVDPDELVQTFTGHEEEIVHWPSSPSCPEAGDNKSQKESRTVLTSISFAEEKGPEAAVPDAPLLPSTEQPCSPGKPIPITTSTVVSLLGNLSPPHDKLPAPADALQLEAKSSALLSDSPPMMPLLPDPECSSFCFESFSPASSPEPLVSLACSQAVQLDSITFETKEDEEKGHSNSSVFKWHTVIPLHEHYVDTPFSYQPTAQTLSLAAPPLLPPQAPEPQTFVGATPPPEIALPFQENEEHSLPFPGELSPLQLPLSPTFSSLDGNGLSPTPSLTDLVHFFSNDDLGMGLDFSNSEPVAVSCPSPSAVEDHRQDRSQQEVANKRYKYKKSRRHKVLKNGVDVKNSTYTSMQPNLEEVEEQLFVSFTSKEALQLHLGEEKPPQPNASLDVQETTHIPENDTTLSLEEKISSFEKILLRDLKLMRHRQVIHPVLQEVGLKMNLLDPTLAIDLQYLGVHLPIPPPRTSLEPVVQELHPAHGACSAFVSRTGKTTDVTQIKGWREKFTPAEATSTPNPPTAEAVAAGSDSQKKNLSAFCSDMLDEYLENEGRLIDERASTFSQPVVDIAPPLAYELPTKSTSYVRTLHSVMQKQTGSATSELISGFIPPSKRPKLSLKETRNFRKEPAKQRGPKHNRPKPKASSASLGQVESNIIDTHPAPAQPDPVLPEPPTLKRKKKHLKPNPTPQTVTLPQTPTTLPSTSEDMAPLDSDSELGDLNSPKSAAQKEDTAAVPPHQEGGAHGMTRALLRQKDLEDGVIWEGRHRTTVTEERASIALTSLFTLMGFVRENPTAPIQLACRRAPPCLNDFCRLGCVCSSLGYCSRISHCGRPACMLGCSCLKQKVVLLKNLDGSDSSPSHHSKKRKKKRRMKMAYVLKEADSVSQPADRVRTLWKRNDRDHDPDPVHIPKRHNMLKRAEQSSCARVRVFRGKKSRRTDEVAPNGLKSKQLQPKSRRQGDPKPETRTSASPTGKPPTPGFPDLQSVGTSPQPSSPGEPQVEAPEEPPPKPSKRLIILAECMWASDNDRNLVLKELCERMACDQLDKPFWIRQYFISPVLQTTEGSGTDCCIQYKIHISTPKPEPENSAASRETAQVVKAAADEQSVHFDDWQREIEPEEVEHLDEERHVAGDGVPEVEVGSASKCEGRAAVSRDAKKRGRGKDDQRRADMGLPFLTGISPAGFLSATRKQPGEGDHAIKVNGKLYPMAKVQLGKMGALHPANRLAAYLTGRVGSSNKRPPSLSSVLSQTLQFQSSDPAPQTIQASVENSGLTGNPPPRPKPSVKVTIPSTTTASQVITNLTQPLNQPNKASKMFMVPVLSSSGMVPMAPVPTPTSTSQKIVLYPVKSTTGVQYFRRPDGQLYRLLPMSQLRQLKLKQAGQTGALPPSHPVLVRQNVSKAPPLTSVITNLVTAASTVSSSANTFTTSSSCSSSTRTSPTSSLLGPLPSLAALLSQKNECTFKTLPAASSSLPSIKSVTCALPLDPSRLAVEQKVTPPPPPTVKTPEDASGPALHSSTQQTGSELELACNPSDLDIICVNEDTRPDDTEGGARRAPQAGREESSSGDESSDSEGGDVGRDEATGPLRKNRLLQNTLEKLRRTKIRLLFDSLRTELGSIDDRTSKASILQKAVQEIQQLVTLESKLKKKKRRLMKKRDRLIDAVSSSGEREQLNASSEQQILEQQHAANQLPAARGGASATPAGKQSCIPVEPFSKPHNNLQAPPPPVPTPVQALKPPPAKPGVSHNASCNNERTVPNILSHRRKPPTPSNNDKEVEKLNNLLVQPSSTLQQQEVLANLPSPPPPAAPPPPPPHILLVPPGPERSSDQSRGLGHPSETLPSCPSSKGPTLCPGPGAGELAVEGVRGSSEEPCKDSNWESLTDDVLINQPMDTAHLQEESVHSSWLLRLDSDSDEPVTSETEEAGLDDRMQCSEHKLLPGPTNGNITNGGALVPPPLLQMRVGGATVVDTTSRPMPRLVPLGLRGTLPS